MKILNFGDYMWKVILKNDTTTIHIQDIITDELQEQASMMGLENLDLRFKDRLVGAGVPVDNDGTISHTAFFEWVDKDTHYIKRMMPDYANALIQLKDNFLHWKSTYGHISEAYKETIIQALLVIVEIEDEQSNPLEYRELFGDGGDKSKGFFRNVRLNPEFSQRHPVEDET